MAPWIWLLLALLLLFIEFYIPSGVTAILAAVFFIISVAEAFSDFGLAGGALFSFCGMFGAALVVWLAISVIKRSSSKNTFFLSASQQGFVGAEADPAYIGKKGVAVSDLRPAGFALIETKRVQVVSDGRYIEKGTHVVVEAAQGGYLVVKPIA